MGIQPSIIFNSITSIKRRQFRRNLLTSAGFGLGLLLATPAMSGTVLTGDAYIAPADFSGTIMQAGHTESGTGQITVDGGSTVEMVKGSNPVETESGPHVGVGKVNGSNGTLTVTGTGSAINMEASGSAASFQIGRNGGTGTVSVNNGGAINIVDSSAVSGSGHVSGESLHVGRDAGSIGILNIDSGSVRLESTSVTSVQVGKNGGAGTINVSGTGTLDLIDTDSVVDSGASVLTMGRENGSNGTLAVTDQGAVTVQSSNSFAGLYVGRYGGSQGLLTLDGPDASLTVNSDTAVPLSGPSSLITLGRDAGSTGTMTVSGGANAQVTGLKGNILVGAAFSGRPTGGNGNLTITGAGSEVLASGHVVVGAFAGGTSTGTVTVADGGLLTTNDVWVGDGGTLNGGGGTIAANVHVDGGVIAPGNSPGVMNILGDLNIMSGALQMEIAGTGLGQYDVLNVFGDFILNPDFVIDLIFQDFTPTVGDSFSLFDILGDVLFSDDGGETTTLGGLDLLTYNVISSRNDEIGVFGSYVEGIFELSVSSLQVSAVPLPPSAILFGTALLGLAGLRRRKRRAA